MGNIYAGDIPATHLVPIDSTIRIKADATGLESAILNCRTYSITLKDVSSEIGFCFMQCYQNLRIVEIAGVTSAEDAVLGVSKRTSPQTAGTDIKTGYGIGTTENIITTFDTDILSANDWIYINLENKDVGITVPYVTITFKFIIR